METIYKYTLNTKGETIIYLNNGYQVLSSLVQNEQIQIWVLLNPELVMLPRKFHVYFTGEELTELNECNGETRIFINTLEIGPYILHVFEIVEQSY